jgi:phage N-6-adenine-methyltransferase
MSNRDNWETPWHIFDHIDKVMNFTIDAAANKDNTKCMAFWSISDNGLAQDWSHNIVWCNPPYLNQAHVKWVKKAITEDTPSCLLIPATVETKLWQKFVFVHANALLFFDGRIKFLHNGEEIGTPRFPSAAALFGMEPPHARSVALQLTRTNLGRVICLV